MEDGQRKEQGRQALVNFGSSDIPPMAKGKKNERKRGNPDFHTSSFYVRKTVNHQFNMALLTMALEGHEYDRSDVLEALMEQWAACPRPIA